MPGSLAALLVPVVTAGSHLWLRLPGEPRCPQHMLGPPVSTRSLRSWVQSELLHAVAPRAMAEAAGVSLLQIQTSPDWGQGSAPNTPRLAAAAESHHRPFAVGEAWKCFTDSNRLGVGSPPGWDLPVTALRMSSRPAVPMGNTLLGLEGLADALVSPSHFRNRPPRTRPPGKPTTPGSRWAAGAWSFMPPLVLFVQVRDPQIRSALAPQKTLSD